MKEYDSIITNEMLDQLPKESFNGIVHLVETLSDIPEVVEWLNRQVCIGFDTETRPSFKKGKSYQVSLLQLSNDTDAYLIRLNKIGMPEAVRSILVNKNIIKVGLAIRDDLIALKKFGSFTPENFIDLQTFVPAYGIEEKGLKKIAAIVLKIRISKGQQTSNWENESLTEAQQLYAATDAWACHAIYNKLISHSK